MSARIIRTLVIPSKSEKYPSIFRLKLNGYFTLLENAFDQVLLSSLMRVRPEDSILGLCNGGAH